MDEQCSLVFSGLDMALEGICAVALALGETHWHIRMWDVDSMKDGVNFRSLENDAILTGAELGKRRDPGTTIIILRYLRIKPEDLRQRIKS